MQRLFTVTDIPQVLEYRPETSTRIMTLEQIEIIMEHNTQAILSVSGDCLEGAGVPDGGWVAVDFTRFPAPPRYKSKGGDGSEDLCLCYAVYPGQHAPAVMCKVYIGVWGPWQTVSTHYDLSKGKHPYNYGMEATRIFGVLFASWDADGNLLWQRDPDSFPEQLGTTPTTRGGNIGDPMPVPKAGRQLEDFRL